MPVFRDESVLIIAPGSHTTLAQLGLPESYTPAALRVKTRMFPAEKPGEWEATKIREKKVDKPAVAKENGETNGETNEEEVGIEYEEDTDTDEGAIWPVRDGKVVDWSCFFALLTHIYNTLNPPFHNPVILIAQPAWTQQDHESLTQFFFEKFKVPAFALMDSAQATLYAYALGTATVVDVGYTKTDVTSVVDFVPSDTGRGIAVADCGGETMTDKLENLLGSKGFNKTMAEQLKKSSICEVLPPGTPLPIEKSQQNPANPAAAASTGVNKSGPAVLGAQNGLPRGPGPGTELGEEGEDKDEEDEGVLDVASIVTSGKTSEILAKKEKERQEKAAAKKASDNAARIVKLPNSQKEKAVLFYDEKRSHQELEATRKRIEEEDRQRLEEEQKEPKPTEEGAAPAGEMVDSIQADKEQKQRARDTSTFIRKEIEVGTERFQAVDQDMLEKIADAVHRCVLSTHELSRRSDLWDSIVVCGNGSKVRGFKEALLATLNSKYLISPSSATIFTSELPSNFSTPVPTGANTPQPQAPPSQGGPNPLLVAATHQQNLNLAPPGGLAQQFAQPNMMGLGAMSRHQGEQHHTSSQTPTSIKLAKMADYFSEWKEHGFEEAHFLGAQVAAKILFIVDGGASKGFMSRNEYNDLGPQGIHEFSFC